MVPLPLVLAAAVALTPTGRAAIFTSLQPACDALGLSDEEGEVAARDVQREGEPITPVAGFDLRDCEPPSKPPTVIDCNDARTGVWVHEMVGTCDMPVAHHHAALRLPPRDHARDAATLCVGATCTRDPLPLRSSTTGFDHSSWLALAAVAPPPPPGSPRRLIAAESLEPESALPRRNERPPAA